MPPDQLIIHEDLMKHDQVRQRKKEFETRRKKIETEKKERKLSMPASASFRDPIRRRRHEKLQLRELQKLANSFGELEDIEALDILDSEFDG